MSDHQQSLFSHEPDPWQQDDQSEKLVATVVFAEGPGGEFDYLVPDRMAGKVELGRRVLAPLGRSNRALTGYCVKLETKPVGQRPLKPLLDILDLRSLVSPLMLQLTHWIAGHYLCEWGQVLDAVVPAGVRGQAGTRMATVLTVAPEVVGQIDRLNLPEKQAKVLKVLAAAGEPLTAGDLGRAAKCTPAPITALRRKGLILARTQRLQTTQREIEPEVVPQHDLKLNDDQKVAFQTILKAIHAREHQTILIHGVTGSGKTEVYIQAIEEAVRFGRQSIVLVPEIALTPQTLERFRARFEHVAVLHSHLSDAERHWQWQRIAEGNVQVVVGARSAIFAPVPHLGLVILDEEHESTFKQDSVPRYNARDVALVRCRTEKVPLVLGSATPSLESWHRAKSGEYRLVEMPRRVLGRRLPSVDTIDLRTDLHSKTSRGSISRQLHMAMNTALTDGGQVILLLNRRGFATHIQCPACGEVVHCPNCEIALTHHRTEEIALCHYCDYQVPAPTACPKCGFAGIRYSGQGTQRLEAEVRARFANYRCLRMDTDTMQGAHSHEKALAAFRSGEVQILVGTQMIAKGLDFPNVTLVGVINADTALHLPDFRAAERTFQLVTQVAGRTGRGEKGGRVLVQTYNPEHPAIVAATRHDYAAFAAEEMPMRQMLSYPPFSSMVRVVVRGPVEEVAKEFAAHIGQQLSAAMAASQPEARILGPAPAPFSKLRGLYRFQIQLQGPDGPKLRQVTRQVTAELRPPEDVQWIVDVDPLEML
ncbi:MAG: primosomal protein N' [Thermoguttaceae bacterium]